MLNKININPPQKIMIVYIVLVAVTLAAFWQVNHFSFVNFDDDVYVITNSNVQSGISLDGVRWAFSTTYADFWHPLTWLSLMFDYQLHGMNAGGYHLTNLILHIMSALLLFWLFNRMTGAIWKSAFVAAIFALHPLHVESVAWVAERKDVLSAFFGILTLCLYVYYTEKPDLRRYLTVLFCFACGLMSKSMVVTLPVIMILLDYWPLGRLSSQKIGTNLMMDVKPISTKQGKQKRKSKKVKLKEKKSPTNEKRLSEAKIAGMVPLWQLWEKIPFFIFSAVISIITLCAQDKPSLRHFPLASRISNAIVSFVTYLTKTFWPHDLAFFYPFSDQIPAWQVLCAVLLIIVISIAVIATAKRLPYLFVGWLWYVIILLPVIGILQVGEFAMADRYSYLPLIGIGIMLAWGIPHLFPHKDDMRKMLLLLAGIAVLAILTVLTWQQCGYWRNSTTLFSHALQVTKNNDIAHNNLASVLLEEGKIEEAIEHYNAAIDIKSNDAYTYFNRGFAYFKIGQYQRAIVDYNEAIRQKTDFAEAYNGRGDAYAKLSQYQQAIEAFKKAIYLNHNYVNAYESRAIIYLNQQNYQLGCLDAQKACELGKCRISEIAKVKGDCH
jgi:Tfp pilus assembly protein PilF